jgi:DUF1680 family protein
MQNRTLNYLKYVDLDRLLYNFRSTHKLSTEGAEPGGGWDAPDFPFRTHMQGHILTAWSQCWASLGDTTCRDRATAFVAELKKCQDNNEAAGFAAGYLSGFPESDFDLLEAGERKEVIYYSLHKTLAGLLDVWRHVGDETAKDVLLKMAEWVEKRNADISYDQMQKILEVEYGGIQDVFAELFFMTDDERWIKVAQKFDQESTNSFLAANEDRLDGFHANTQIPKWIGAIREYKATGTSKYLDIASNSWSMVVDTHSYSIGGNSQNEHFHGPNEIAGYLTHDTAEHCNSYNMLKLTKELWTLDPSAKYINFYEQALQNHILGAQDPESSHGHITYFSPLNPGGRKGKGPVWGGGTWSTDYDSFWCCQGSGVEQNTRLMDVIYGYDDSSLYVNMYAPSTLDWKDKNIKITQTGHVPADDTFAVTVNGERSFDMKIRIAPWASGAEISVNGEVQSIDAEPGQYATISRSWATGDKVTVKLSMKLYLIPANDDKNLATLAYGPVVLIGNYGDSEITEAPTIDLGSLTRVNDSDLKFRGTADGKDVELGPYQDGGAHFNYVTYWNYSGSLS